jgi:hypothetical protein
LQPNGLFFAELTAVVSSIQRENQLTQIPRFKVSNGAGLCWRLRSQ